MISGLHPIGGGSKLCGFEVFFSTGRTGGGGGGGAGAALLPLVCPSVGFLATLGGGGGGGAGGPVGNTWKGIPIAAAPKVAAGDTADGLLLLLLVL